MFLCRKVGKQARPQPCPAGRGFWWEQLQSAERPHRHGQGGPSVTNLYSGLRSSKSIAGSMPFEAEEVVSNGTAALSDLFREGPRYANPQIDVT